MTTKLTRDEVAEALSRWEKFMWKIASWWYYRNRSFTDLEELFAEVRAGFFEAASRFDKARGIQFSTYAGWWGNNYARSYVRREAAHGIHVPRYGRNAGIVIVDTERMPSVADRVYDRESEEAFEVPPRFWKRIREALVLPAHCDPDRRYSDVKYRVVWLRFNRDWTLSKIAHKTGISKQAVSQHLKSAAKMIRARCPEMAEYLN